MYQGFYKVDCFQRLQSEQKLQACFFPFLVHVGLWGKSESSRQVKLGEALFTGGVLSCSDLADFVYKTRGLLNMIVWKQLTISEWAKKTTNSGKIGRDGIQHREYSRKNKPQCISEDLLSWSDVSRETQGRNTDVELRGVFCRLCVLVPWKQTLCIYKTAMIL